MIGLGTIINVGSIIVGGILGLLFGKLLNDRFRDSLCKACGLATLFLAIGGAVSAMLEFKDGVFSSGKALLIVISLVLGVLLGELINLEGLTERFGNFLKDKTGSSKDNSFTEGFVCTSTTVCIGAMAVIGSIEDGINGNYTILLTKSILDFIIVMALTGSMGKGCIFSAIPVFIIQGLITLLAVLIKPVLTDLALLNLSLVGSILIFCVGVNLVWGKIFKVANLLPAILIAVVLAYIPLGL